MRTIIRTTFNILPLLARVYVQALTLEVSHAPMSVECLTSVTLQRGLLCRRTHTRTGAGSPRRSRTARRGWPWRWAAGAYNPPLLSSTSAVFGPETLQPPEVSLNKRSRIAKLWISVRGLHPSTSQLILSRCCHRNHLAFRTKSAHVKPKSGRV